MNAQASQFTASRAPQDDRIHDTVARLASLVYKLEASKDAEQRSGFIREMHRASTLLQLLLQIECECEDASGLQSVESPCERAAHAHLAAYTDDDPESDCPFARIAEETRSQRGDVGGKGGER